MFEYKTRAFLKDILEAANRIMIYTEHMTYDAFLADLKTQDAVVRNLEILGEATKQIPDEFRQHALHIPWKSIARMRDKLIHQYFGVTLILSGMWCKMTFLKSLKRLRTSFQP
jgi:uncharacterized protein with HEPN domain